MPSICIKFTSVNREVMYERPGVNLSEAQLLCLSMTFHTLPLFYLQCMKFMCIYPHKNYAKMEIYL